MSRPPDPTKLITIGQYSDGSPKQITERLRGFLKLVGIPESSVYQGCHHHGSLSASTHDGLECIDVPYTGDNPSELKKLRDAGACAWPRDERDSSDYAGSNRHTHLVLPNGIRINRKIDPLAMSQVHNYWLGGNGLAGGGKDRYSYRPKGHPKFHYRKWWYNQDKAKQEKNAAKRIKLATHNHGELWHKLVQFVIKFRKHNGTNSH